MVNAELNMFTHLSGCGFRCLIKLDVVEPESFMLIPHILHSAVLLFGPCCLKFLKLKLLMNGTAAAAAVDTFVSLSHV